MLIDGATSRAKERAVPVSKLPFVRRVIVPPDDKQEETNGRTGCYS
jgi:hypothetical protein